MIQRTSLARRDLLKAWTALGFALVVGGGESALAAGVGRRLPVTVHKDPNCGCCTAWAERMRTAGGFAPRLVETSDIMAVKTRLRVPPNLASCHTSEIGGYVIEGHVPPSDILRLLREKPKGVVGLAVPGMPAGSPGMETADGRRSPFEVFAFTAEGRTHVFARYGI